MFLLCHSTSVSCIAGILTFLKSRPFIGDINTIARYDGTANILSEYFLEIHAEISIKGSLFQPTEKKKKFLNLIVGNY